MRTLTELMTVGEAAGAAAALRCELEDVIRIARMSLEATDVKMPDRPEAFCSSLLSIMRLAEQMVERLGVSDLGREARRGIWREPVATGAEEWRRPALLPRPCRPSVRSTRRT